MSTSRSPAALLALPLALVLAATACGGDDPAAPEVEPGPVILLGDGRTEDSVRVILARAGIHVQSAGPYWEYDGTGLADASAVIFLCGYSYDMAMAEDVQQQIVAFVEGGGGLLTTEWMLYNTSYDPELQGLVAAIIPALYGGGYVDTGNPGDGVETYTRAAAGHPIAEGLPASFGTPELDWSYSMTVVDPASAKMAQVIYAGSLSGAAVVTGRHGAGRTAHWNMGGEWVGSRIWTPEMRQLLVNVASWVSGRT